MYVLHLFNHHSGALIVISLHKICIVSIGMGHIYTIFDWFQVHKTPHAKFVTLLADIWKLELEVYLSMYVNFVFILGNIKQFLLTGHRQIYLKVLFMANTVTYY